MDEPLGTLHRDPDGRRVLRYERHLAHPREKVWRAITDSGHLRARLPCDVVGERRAGARLTLPFWPEVVAAHGERIGEDTATTGEVRVWDPPAVFEWTWDVDVLRWELVPTAGGTLLTFTTWIGDPDLPPADPAAGWHDCLHRLAALLDGHPGGPTAEAEIARVEERYARLAAIP
ncbi:SRPBCC domain-containing protein [Kineococcus glutinatus]|uniref:Activator of Hsp90 ATPase homologue 1/2-like C-terminal domain-containing protein n=1 Tax=Kineococcus glutinatus TaxID=1070872 RepID=A0ABP9HVX1_9ACTN